MSKSWVCIHCGTGFISKCPGQRSVFPGMEVGVWQSILATHVVHSPDGHRELYINMSVHDSEDKSDAALILKAIDDMAVSKDVISRALCDHELVLNSHTERECSMGCKSHHNLSDKATLLKPKGPKELIFASDMVKETSAVINNALEQVRKQVNITKKTFDHFAENEMDRLKTVVRNMAHSWGIGDPVLGQYKLERYEYDKPDSSYSLYFAKYDSLYTYVRALKVSGALDSRISLYHLTEKGDYERMELDFSSATCTHCNKPLDLDGFTVNGQAHVNCHVKHMKMLEVKRRMVYAAIPKDIEDTMWQNGYRNDWYINSDGMMGDLRRVLYTNGLEEAVTLDLPDSCSVRREYMGKDKLSRKLYRFFITSTGYAAKKIQEIFLAN